MLVPIASTGDIHVERFQPENARTFIQNCKLTAQLAVRSKSSLIHIQSYTLDEFSNADALFFVKWV